MRLPAKRLLPELDIDAEMRRNNFAIVELLILSALIKGSADERREIIAGVTPGIFTPRQLPRFLFLQTITYLERRSDRTVTAEWLMSQIEKFYATVWATKPNKREVKGQLFTCAQILDFNPTAPQLARAIEIRKKLTEEQKSFLRWIEEVDVRKKGGGGRQERKA